MAKEKKDPKQGRLVSLDAYRGFVMLAMASGGFAIASTWETLRENAEWMQQNSQTALTAWRLAAHHLEHVDWAGCSFWDLIQPSFMFMVGVAMPFSYAKRMTQGDSKFRRVMHMLFRSFVLVALGVFLYSQHDTQTNFIFTNVLAQIGLAYPFVYLFLNRNWKVQLSGVAVIALGYWAFFAFYPVPKSDTTATKEYVTTQLRPEDAKTDYFNGFGAHWNKHTNAGAYADRTILNWFPRSSVEGKTFWANRGGYLTLNFIPSIITMVLGLMAGQLLRGEGTWKHNIKLLLLAGLACFIISMVIDTTIWPSFAQFSWANWSGCPVVKRIWTPSFAIFSAGWTFWMLAAFYLVIDVWGFKRLSVPLALVGMNSIAFYLMYQMMRPWLMRMAEIHLATLDIWIKNTCLYLAARVEACASWSWERGLNYYLFSDAFAYSQIAARVFSLFLLWLIAAWMYRRRIFVRI